MVYRGLYILLSTRVLVITLFCNIFSLCFCMLSEFTKVFDRKVCRVQGTHLHNVASALSSPSRWNLDKDLFRYLWCCGKKQIECGLAWCVLLSTTTRVITVVKICCGLTRRTTFWPLWWRVPLSIRVHTTLSRIRFVNVTFAVKGEVKNLNRLSCN